jgi:hypothetical protein
VKLKTRTIERLRDALLESGRRPSVVVSSAYETLTREGLLSPEEITALNRVDPLAETMFLMMAADGKLTSGEHDAVRGGIRISEQASEAESAFALAAAVALADDDVAEEENAFINQLAVWFGIGPERASAILDQIEDDKTD